MPQTEEEYQKTFRSEKQRIGLVGIALGLIIYYRTTLHDGDFWNFPCNSPCAHFTVWLVPTIDNWLILSLGYIVSMAIYVSEDTFDKYRWGRTVREIARRVGTRFFIFYYPLTIPFFAGFGGISFQLPDYALVPYWLAVFALFGFYMIWTAEGMLGTKIIGKRNAFNKPTETFLEIGREGAQVFVDGLVHGWRWFLAKLRLPTPGPINSKRAARLFIAVVELVVVSVSYFVLHLSGFGLLWAFGVPLYAIVGASVILGWRRRKRKPSTNKTEGSDTDLSGYGL